MPLSTQQILPPTTLKFLHALLPNSYITSQTLFLVNLNPHLFHPPSPLPSTVHPSHLPQAFADFFANKIATIRHSLDIDSTSSPTCNDSLVSHLQHSILFLRLLSRTALGNPVSKLVSLTLSQLPSSVSVLTLFFPTLQLLLITLLCLAPSLSPSNLLS